MDDNPARVQESLTFYFYMYARDNAPDSVDSEHPATNWVDWVRFLTGAPREG